jgi:hypothetical protein
MSIIQVGLIDKTGELDPELVQAAAAALNVQVTHELPQFWSGDRHGIGQNEGAERGLAGISRQAFAAGRRRLSS